MKIIDSRGKLFGWINIIDFFAIILALILVRMFFLGHKLYIGNKMALAELRQEEQANELARAEAKAMAEASIKRSIEDRLASLEASKVQTDASFKHVTKRLRSLEVLGQKRAPKKNRYPY